MVKPRRIMIRAASDGHLSSHPVRQPYRFHQAATRRTLKSHVIPNEDLTTAYQFQQNRSNYGSYWSPTVSEIDFEFRPLGSRRIKRKLILHILILCFLSASMTFVEIRKGYHATDIGFQSEILFAVTGFLTSLFGPFILGLSANWLLVIGSVVTAVCFGALSIYPNYLIGLITYPVVGMCFALTTIFVSSSTLISGMQYASIKDVLEKKELAGDWYLWTQVLSHWSVILVSMGSSGIKMWMMTKDQALQIVHPLDAKKACGKHVCWNLPDQFNFEISNSAGHLSSGHFLSSNKSHEAENDRANMIDGSKSSGSWDEMSVLAVMAFATALLSVLFSILDCWLSKSRSRLKNYPNDCGRHSAEHLGDLQSLSDATQIYRPSISSQLADHLQRFLFDHKLQTVLPIAFWIGLQSVFIRATFMEDFISCVLTSDYIGFGLSAYTLGCLLSLYAVFRFGVQMKRVLVILWLAFLQAGAAAVIFLWPPGSHDMAVFFVLPFIFGLTGGGLRALVSDLLVHVFIYDWPGVISFITASGFLGSAAGICLKGAFCNAAQMGILLLTLLVALIPFCMINSKYDSYKQRTKTRPSFL